MKVLYLIRDGRDATVDALIAAQEKDSDLTVLDLGAEDDYDRVVALVEQADRVISW